MKVIDNNPKTKFGMQKPSLSKIPGAALIYTALAFMDGAKKYDAYNWRENEVTASIYLDAAMRHLLAWQDGEHVSTDTQPPVSHLGHAMACLSILIDAYENGNLIDDRPKPGPSARLIKELTASLLPSEAMAVVTGKAGSQDHVEPGNESFSQADR
jgi:hypothetical protein